VQRLQRTRGRGGELVARYDSCSDDAGGVHAETLRSGEELSITGREHELFIEQAVGGCEVHGVVAPQVMDLGELAGLASKVVVDIDHVELGEQLLTSVGPAESR
jgi:hypothetical protein